MRHAESLETLRKGYTADVVERVRPRGITVSHEFVKQEGAIPLPVTFSMEVARRIGEQRSGMQARLSPSCSAWCA